MKFRADPLSFFRNRLEPMALYARRHWLGDDVGHLMNRMAQQVEETQFPDGSWDRSVARTIEQMFTLWLLRGGWPTRAMRRGLDWLMETEEPPMVCTCNDGGRYDGMLFRLSKEDRAALRKMDNTPFTSGCGGFVKTGAAMFFCGVLNCHDRPQLKAIHDSLLHTAAVRDGRLCSGSCASNIIQGMVVLPWMRQGAAMQRVIAYLFSCQRSSGKWDDAIPFYQTLFALSQLESPIARQQVQRSLACLEHTQNADGSWGRNRQLICSFLATAAMLQASILSSERQPNS